MKEYTKTIISGNFVPTDSGSAVSAFDPQAGKGTIELNVRAEIDPDNFPTGADILQVFRAALEETLDACGYKKQFCNIHERRARRAISDAMLDAQEVWEGKE